MATLEEVLAALAQKQQQQPMTLDEHLAKNGITPVWAPYIGRGRAPIIIGNKAYNTPEGMTMDQLNKIMQDFTGQPLRRGPTRFQKDPLSGVYGAGTGEEQ